MQLRYQNVKSASGLTSERAARLPSKKEYDKFLPEWEASLVSRSHREHPFWHNCCLRP